MESRWERFMVPIVFLLFVLLRSADNVFRKRVQNALGPLYTSMCFNFIWPIAVQIITAFMVAGYIWLQRRYGRREYTWRFFLSGSKLASGSGIVPLYLLALMNLPLQLNAALTSLPAPFVSMTMQSLLTNTSLIWMMLLSFCWLGTRFRQNHLAGTALALLSVLVGISGRLSHVDCSPEGMQAGECLDSYKNNAGEWVRLGSGAMLFWYCFFAAGWLPAAVGQVFAQKLLQERDMDIMYAKWWAGNFQILWGWLCVWVTWIPTPASRTTPGETFSAFMDMLQCMVGRVPHLGDESCAAGGLPAAFWFSIYLFFNCSYVLCLLWLTKRMSAVWTQIATVLCLDLTNIFSQWKFLAGGGATAMGLDDWLGTLLASVALWVYCLAPEKKMIREVGPADAKKLIANDGQSALIKAEAGFGADKNDSDSEK